MRTKLPEKFMYTDYHLEDARQKEVVLPPSFSISPLLPRVTAKQNKSFKSLSFYLYFKSIMFQKVALLLCHNKKKKKKRKDSQESPSRVLLEWTDQFITIEKRGIEHKSCFIGSGSVLAAILLTAHPDSHSRLGTDSRVRTKSFVTFPNESHHVHQARDHTDVWHHLSFSVISAGRQPP